MIISLQETNYQMTPLVMILQAHVHLNAWHLFYSLENELLFVGSDQVKVMRC